MKVGGTEVSIWPDESHRHKKREKWLSDDLLHLPESGSVRPSHYFLIPSYSDRDGLLLWFTQAGASHRVCWLYGDCGGCVLNHHRHNSLSLCDKPSMKEICKHSKDNHRNHIRTLHQPNTNTAQLNSCRALHHFFYLSSISVCWFTSAILVFSNLLTTQALK